MAASPAPHSLTIDKITAQADILGGDRFVLVFDSLPGTGSSEESETASILCCEVTLPQIQVGHVRIPLYGQPVAFRGGIEHQNRFSASFYDTVDGTVIKALWRWLNRVRNLAGNDSAEKSEYAINGEVLQLDTTGRTAYGFEFRNIWPVNLTPAPMTEDGGPVRHTAEFSFDQIKMQGESDGDEGDTDGQD